MTYYEPAKDWYCFKCNAYSRLNTPYGVPMDSVSKRSIIRVMSLIVGLLGIISIFLILFGLGQLNQSMMYNDYNYYEGDSYRTEMAFKGAMDICIAVVLLMFTYAGLRSTLSKGAWWEKMHKYVDTTGTDPLAAGAIKMLLVGTFQVYYGVLIACGAVFLGVGIFYLNVFDASGLYAVAALEAVLGAILILLSYIAYGMEMVRLSRDVYPLLANRTDAGPAPGKPGV
jgi:hypothetical protein